MLVGTSSADVTPDRFLPLMGQLHERVARYARDALTVNAVAFRGPQQPGGAAATTAALVSIDVCVLPDAWVRATQETCAQACGISAANVLIHATHTHVAPLTVEHFVGALDPGFMRGLSAATARAVSAAVADLEDVDLFSGEGHLSQMGWNRRGLHAGGGADMYHGSWAEDFAGIEGPRDGAVPVIIARKRSGSTKAIITGFATHPNCVEGESYYSADLPGAVRRFLRRNAAEAAQPDGAGLGVVYLTGAAGDTAPSIMQNNPKNLQPWRGEAGLERSGRYLGSEVLKVAFEQTPPLAEPMADPLLRLASIELSIPIRVWPESFNPGELRWEGARNYFGAERDIWHQVRDEGDCPVRLNVLRLGDAAICTNPAELYCAFGLEIKRRSPAKTTIVAELTDGYCGYVPTARAIAGGGYSTWPARSCKLEESAGEAIVEATATLLRQAFNPATADASSSRTQTANR